MRKHKYIFLILTLFILSCKNQQKPYDEKTAEVINTFYGDALGDRESYELLRDLSKNVGSRLSGSEGAKKLFYGQRRLWKIMVLIQSICKRLWFHTGKGVL